MTDSPTLVPSDELAAQLPKIGEKYFTPEALELCRGLKGRKVADLSEDEILMLALASQTFRPLCQILLMQSPGCRDSYRSRCAFFGAPVIRTLDRCTDCRTRMFHVTERLRPR
jgi:hypothetical protein